jgi:hypothetical protein
MKVETKKAMHINDALHLLERAAKEGTQVNLRAWKKDGNAVDYMGWQPMGGHWQGGTQRLKNPVNGEIRAVIDVLIYEINGHPVYL